MLTPQQRTVGILLFDNVEVLDFAGPDRILAGSDYPHQIGSIPLMIDTIKKLDVSDTVKQKIFAGNAAALLGVK